MTQPAESSGVIARLLGGESPSAFIHDYYLKLPYARQTGAEEFCPLGSWQTVEDLFGEPEADVRLSARGELYTEGRPTFDVARQLFAEGSTIFVRHAERHHAGLRDLAAHFESDLAGPVDIHLFCTPADTTGFGWHYDAEEVFFLQTHGTKNYQLRKNTVNPWPLVETLPQDMQYQREIMPLTRCTLSAGDWLYLPAGYWHATATTSESISLAVGVLAPSGMNVYDQLRADLVDSLLWRGRLPTSGHANPLSADELRQRYAEIVTELGKDLQRRLTSESLIERLIARRDRRE